MGQLAVPAMIAAQLGSTALEIGGDLSASKAQEEQQRAANAQDALALEERRLRNLDETRKRLAVQRALFGATGRAGTDPTLETLQRATFADLQRAGHVEQVQTDLAMALRKANIKRLKRERGFRIASGALQGAQDAFSLYRRLT